MSTKQDTQIKIQQKCHQCKKSVQKPIIPCACATHAFHDECLLEYLEENQFRCPDCQTEVKIKTLSKLNSTFKNLLIACLAIIYHILINMIIFLGPNLDYQYHIYENKYHLWKNVVRLTKYLTSDIINYLLKLEDNAKISVIDENICRHDYKKVLDENCIIKDPWDYPGPVLITLFFLSLVSIITVISTVIAFEEGMRKKISLAKAFQILHISPIIMSIIKLLGVGYIYYHTHDLSASLSYHSIVILGYFLGTMFIHLFLGISYLFISLIFLFFLITTISLFIRFLYKFLKSPLSYFQERRVVVVN